MTENYYETPKGILEILWQDGYHAAARLIERLQSDNRTAEFEFMRSYVAESCFDDAICRDRLRMLWTAYCLHHDLDVDTAGYDNDLLELWSAEVKDWLRRCEERRKAPKFDFAE